MAEAQVGFLYKIAASVCETSQNSNHSILKSYYLMRCHETTRGFGLPDKYFSSEVRCNKCFLEWDSHTKIKVKPVELSKRQRKRLKSRKVTQNKKQYIRNKKDLLISNKIEQICAFCKKSKYTVVKKQQNLDDQTDVEETQPQLTNSEQNTEQKIAKIGGEKKHEINVYTNALDVFSLQNKNNILSSTIKEKPKVINNSKRKKDKFAGLCQKAVLASAKLKQEKTKRDSLNLFLKPSST